jgi:nicotinamidase-related amidase
MAENTSLLVMDVQEGIVKSLGKHADAYLKKVQTAVDGARQAGVPVFFIVVRFREGFPEMNPRNKMFSRIAKDASDTSMTEASESTQPAISPENGELVVAKKRVSAFAGSDLEMILQAQGITHLVLCGIATSGVVLSTLRQAADKDYELTVLKDACADRDDEVHRVLTEKVFPRQANVITSKEWATSLAGATEA